MSVQHAGRNYRISQHGVPSSEDFDSTISLITFPGVRGEAISIQPANGQWVSLDIQLTGFGKEAALLDHVTLLRSWRGLHGDLYVNIDETRVPHYPNTTLVEVRLQERPWLDGSGTNGWQCAGQILWRYSVHV